MVWQVTEKLDRLLDRPVVAHAYSAVTRYNERLGAQFAAGITYFTVLSLVPILMFTFSVIGLTLTVLRPEMLDQLTVYINEALDSSGFATSLSSVIDEALHNWRGIGLAAFFTAVYSGSKWAGNLKRAVRIMWSDNFDDGVTKKHFFLELGANLIIFLGLIVSVGVGAAVTALGSGFTTQVISWLGADDVPGIGPIVQVAALLCSFLACWLLMVFLFIALPTQPVAPRPWLVGTLIGAVAITVLQAVAGILVRVMSQNVTAGIFGNVIVVMLMCNVLASIILMTAAWVGTDRVWEVERSDRRADRATTKAQLAGTVPAITVPVPTVVGVTPIGPTARYAGRREPGELRDPATPLPSPGKAAYVRQDVAARGMRVNLWLGYGLGGATGLGVGGLLLRLLRRR